MTDAERLTWYQNQHTLHLSLELLYCVDHYELSKVDESERTLWITQGETLAECIDKAVELTAGRDRSTNSGDREILASGGTVPAGSYLVGENCSEETSPPWPRLPIDTGTKRRMVTFRFDDSDLVDIARLEEEGFRFATITMRDKRGYERAFKVWMPPNSGESK